MHEALEGQMRMDLVKPTAELLIENFRIARFSASIARATQKHDPVRR